MMVCWLLLGSKVTGNIRLLVRPMAIHSFIVTHTGVSPRVIIRSLDKVKNDDARARFARKAATLVRTNDTLKSLKSSMEESPDPVVQKAIKEN